MKKNCKCILIIYLIIIFLTTLSKTYKLQKVKLEPFTVCDNCEEKTDIDQCLICPTCGWCQTMGQNGKCVQQDSHGLALFKETCDKWTPGGYFPYYNTTNLYPFYYRIQYPWYNPWNWFMGWPWRRSNPRRLIRSRYL